MDTKYLQKQKRRLLDLRGRLCEEIPRMLQAVREEQRPIGEHEWRAIPSESAEKEINLELTEEAIHQAVNAAIERVENGTYGQCTDCGRRIAQTRLNAIPYVERCLKCEQTLAAV
jgi:DnaK suppressor protein